METADLFFLLFVFLVRARASKQRALPPLLSMQGPPHTVSQGQGQTPQELMAAASAMRVNVETATSSNAPRIAVLCLNLNMLLFSLWPQSLNANEAGRSM